MGKNDKDVESEQANPKTNPTVMQGSLTVISNNYLEVPHQQIHLSKISEKQKEMSSKRLIKAHQFRVEDVLEKVMQGGREPVVRIC